MPKLIQEGALKGFPLDTWRFLTGDVNRLDDGATYVRMDDSSIEYRELHNLPSLCGESAKTTYRQTVGYIDLSDLADDDWISGALRCSGWDPEGCPIDTREGILMRVEAAISYGSCAESTNSGNGARKLLGFDPWCPQL